MPKEQVITVKVNLDTAEALKRAKELKAAIAPKPFFTRAWVAVISVAVCLAAGCASSLGAAWFGGCHAWWAETASVWCGGLTFVWLTLAFMAFCCGCTSDSHRDDSGYTEL